MLTLTNFDNFLSPAALVSGTKILVKKGVKSLTEEEKDEWVGQVKDGPEIYDVFVRLGKNEIIQDYFCSCAEFMAAQHLEDPQGKACPHSLAVLIFMRNKINGQPTPVGKKANRKLKKEKDASLKIIDNIEPIKIIDFVKDLLQKDVGFKSQFMLYFSQHEIVDEAQYKNIILNAIKNVRGRKKYLTAGDGSKISQNLTPLLNQAAAAESKRHFREAFTITKLFLEDLLPLSEFFKTISVRFEKFTARIHDLWQLLAQSTSLPNDLKEEIFDTLKNKFESTYTDEKNNLRSFHYESFMLACKAQSKEDAMETVLLNGLYPKNKKVKRTDFETLRHVEYVANYYQKVIDDKEKLQKHLEKFKKKDSIAKRLIHFYLENDLAPKATREINRLIKEGAKNKPDHWHITRTDEFWDLHFRALVAAEQPKKAADLAEKRFVASKYQDFNFFDMARETSTATEWEKREAKFLKATQNSRSFHEANSFFKILTIGFHYKTLHSFLLKKCSPDLILKHGELLFEDKPDLYIDVAHRTILHFVKLVEKQPKKADTHFNKDCINLIKKLSEISSGKKLAKRHLKSMTAFSFSHLGDVEKMYKALR